MKRLVLTALMVTAFGLMVSDAHGQLFRKKKKNNCCPTTCCAPTCDPCCAPSCGYTVKYVEKKVTCYKTVWQEKEIEEVCYKVKYVKVPYKYHVCKPVWKEEPRKITCYKTVAVEVVRDVVRCHYVTTCCVDPCTGCTYTCCKPVRTVHKVKCVEHRCVAYEKEVTVRVCHYVKEECEGHYLRCVTEPYKVKRKVRFCVSVPYEATVRVAVCVPCYHPCGHVGHPGHMPYAK